MYNLIGWWYVWYSVIALLCFFLPLFLGLDQKLKLTH